MNDAEAVVQPVADMDKLVKVYIKIRDARDQLRRELEEKEADLNEQLALIEQEILELCKQTNVRAAWSVLVCLASARISCFCFRDQTRR